MKLLLPIDGSDCANKTLLWAAETFNRDKAEYCLLFVIPVLPDLNTVEFDVADASALLKRARTLLEDRGCKVLRAEYAMGDAVERICHAAEEMDVDQVVIGSHGRTGFSKLMMGSVSIRVLERCRRPVTVHRNVEVKNALHTAEDSHEHSTLHAIPENTLL